MVNIAICDDSRAYLDEATDFVLRAFKSMNIPCGVRKYEHPSLLKEELLTRKFDLVILDIVMPEINGIELARHMRDNGIASEIIFITTNDEFALESYDVFPLTFITKPINEDKFIGAIKKFIEKSNFSESVVIKSCTGDKLVARAEDLLYIESQGHSVVYTFEDRVITSSTTANFTRAVEELPSYFFRCHRCYSVNMKRVHSICSYEFTMDNGDKIPISKNLFKAAKQNFVLNA